MPSWGRRTLDVLLAVTIIALLTLLAARLESGGGRKLAGGATVHDGDTLTVAGERLRLLGIDAPELSQTCARGGKTYGCGREAQAALSDLVADGQVACEGSRRDRYKRLLAVCHVGTVEINARMVEEGWAVAFGDFAAEEKQAKQRGAGLWAGTFDRPRDWRVSHGDLGETEHDAIAGIGDWLRRLFGL